MVPVKIYQILALLGFCARLCSTKAIPIGCYIDSADRDLDGAIHNLGGENEPSRCIAYCNSHGFRYAGLQATHWCLCGQTYGKYGTAAESECNHVCPGDSSYKCGAGWRNSVYSIDDIDCGKPTPPAGYIYGTPTLTTYGGTVKVSCATGYEVSPESHESTCQADGSWSIPTGCRKVDCADPTYSFTKDGYILGTVTTTDYESQVQISCATGYEVTGGGNPDPIFCQADRTWSTQTECTLVKNTSLSECNDDFYICPQTRKCIKKEYLCDGYTDCHDYSDEASCTTRVCPYHYEFGEQFPCHNNTGCVGHLHLCDGRKDCPGGEDEDKCDEHGCYEGITSYVRCSYFSSCFLLSKICNGQNICQFGPYKYRPNPGIDTTNCDAFSCPSGYFKCGTGKCLRESRVCDGNYDDCGDASDETNCNFSCAGRCNRSTPRYWCNCNIACRLDNSCCHDYDDVCSAPPSCKDLVDFNERSLVEITLPPAKDRVSSRANLVLRDSFNVTDNSIYVVYRNFSCTLAQSDGCMYSPCTSLVIYGSYGDLENDTVKAKLTLSLNCFINTIRIYNGRLYCQIAENDTDQYGRKYMATYILKIDLSNGIVLNRRKVDVDSANLCNDHNYMYGHLIIEYLIDFTGFWLFYKSRTTQKPVLELIDTDDLGTMHTIHNDDIGPKEYSARNPMLMICGKIYHFNFTSDNIRVTKAIDILNPDNTYFGATSLANNIMSGLPNVLLHYNPATNEVFAYAATYLLGETRIFKFSPQICKYPFLNITDLSDINSTFLWSLIQTETGTLRQMVDLLSAYFKLTDPDSLSKISDTLLTCRDRNCYDKPQSLSLYCIIEQAMTDLKIYSDHRQVSKSSAIVLQTDFHMKELLQQKFNRETASKIDDLKLHMSHSFEDLKQTVISLQNTLQKKLGDYFSNLAKYDQKKADADVNFIYGRLEKYTNKIKEDSEILANQLTNLFIDAIGSASANIIGKARRVVFASLAAANPVDKILGRMDSILTLMDAIDELMIATRDLHRAIYIKNILSKIKRQTEELSGQMENNMKTQTTIKHMIQAGFSKQLSVNDTVKYMNDFLKEYNNYSPIFTAGMFANYEAMLDSVVDELCDVIFSGDTTEAGIAQHVIVSKGSCINIKVDVARLIANYEEMYDFQFDLMEAMASFVRASVAMASAQKLSETIDGALTVAQREQNDLALKVYALQMYTVNNIHMNMVVQDACNLIKYKNGGRTTDYCRRLLLDSHTTEFDKLVAYPYETDMCAADSIQKYVNIPAKVKDNTTDTLPSFMIDLAELYRGREVEFQIPDSSWLVTHKWLNEVDVKNPLFIKQFQLFIPPFYKDHYGTADLHVIVDMDGDNSITKNGDTYIFSSPVQYNFRYTLDSGCFTGHILDSKRNPYNVIGCPDRLETPCVTSEGSISGSTFHPSIFARWKLRAHISGNLLQPNPATEFYLRAGLTICKSGITRSMRHSDELSYLMQSQECCSDGDMYYNILSDGQHCQSCPAGSCPNLQGFYCESNCTLVQT